jgi:cell division protein FtsW (lipid II flippase)
VKFSSAVPIMAGPIGLIMLEPDAGQALTYFRFRRCLVLSAIQIRYVVLVMVAAAVFRSGKLYHRRETGAIKRYQQERINAVLDPESVDPEGIRLSHDADRSSPSARAG